MPRTAKRMQTPAAPQEQGYGVRGEQIASQNQMGIPDNQSEAPMPSDAAAGAVPPGMPPEGAAPGSPGNITDPAQLLAMMQSQAPPPPGGLARPTDRPNEPVTAGLGEAPQSAAPNKAADTLDAIAATTGDQRFAALAQRARMI